MSEVKQGRATQDAVTALTQYLIDSGAENYIEDHYTITLDGSEPTTAVITVQYTDKPSPHELRLQAEQERDTLRTANQRLEGEVARLREALKKARQRISSLPVETTPQVNSGKLVGHKFKDSNLDVIRVLNEIDAALAGDGGDV